MSVNLGKWKAQFMRFWGYFSFSTSINALLILAGVEIPLWVSLPLYAVPSLLFVWKLDLGKVFPEELQYNAMKTPMLVDLVKDIKVIRGIVEHGKPM